MRVNNVDSLANQYVPHQRVRSSERRERIFIDHGQDGAVINLEGPRHVPNSSSFGPSGWPAACWFRVWICRAGVGMSYHNHLVSMPYQSLRQGIDVILHSPKARVKEVTNERNAVRHCMYYYVVLVVSVEACGVWSSGASIEHRAGRAGIGHRHRAVEPQAAAESQSRVAESPSRKNSGRFTYVLYEYVRTFSFGPSHDGWQKRKDNIEY